MEGCGQRLDCCAHRGIRRRVSGRWNLLVLSLDRDGGDEGEMVAEEDKVSRDGAEAITEGATTLRWEQTLRINSKFRHLPLLQTPQRSVYLLIIHAYIIKLPNWKSI